MANVLESVDIKFAKVIVVHVGVMVYEPKVLSSFKFVIHCEPEMTDSTGQGLIPTFENECPRNSNLAVPKLHLHG